MMITCKDCSTIIQRETNAQKRCKSCSEAHAKTYKKNYNRTYKAFTRPKLYCLDCQIEIPPRVGSGSQPIRCAPCKKTYRTLYRRAWNYNLTVEQLRSLGTLCWVCGEPGQAVDHDHFCCPGEKACGSCTRGLLCHRCNHAIGLMKDSPELCNRLADYLNGVTTAR